MKTIHEEERNAEYELHINKSLDKMRTNANMYMMYNQNFYIYCPEMASKLAREGRSILNRLLRELDNMELAGEELANKLKSNI